MRPPHWYIKNIMPAARSSRNQPLVGRLTPCTEQTSPCQNTVDLQKGRLAWSQAGMAFKQQIDGSLGTRVEARVEATAHAGA